MEARFLQGVRRMSRGIRTGNAGMALAGAALAAWAFVRRTDGPAEQLVQVLKVRPGDEIRVAVTPAGVAVTAAGQRTR